MFKYFDKIAGVTIGSLIGLVFVPFLAIIVAIIRAIQDRIDKEGRSKIVNCFFTDNEDESYSESESEKITLRSTMTAVLLSNIFFIFFVALPVLAFTSFAAGPLILFPLILLGSNIFWFGHTGAKLGLSGLLKEFNEFFAREKIIDKLVKDAKNKEDVHIAGQNNKPSSEKMIILALNKSEKTSDLNYSLSPEKDCQTQLKEISIANTQRENALQLSENQNINLLLNQQNTSDELPSDKSNVKRCVFV